VFGEFVNGLGFQLGAEVAPEETTLKKFYMRATSRNRPGSLCTRFQKLLERASQTWEHTSAAPTGASDSQRGAGGVDCFLPGLIPLSPYRGYLYPSKSQPRYMDHTEAQPKGKKIVHAVSLSLLFLARLGCEVAVFVPW